MGYHYFCVIYPTHRLRHVMIYIHFFPPLLQMSNKNQNVRSFTYVQRKKSNKQLSFLHQWLGREGTCGGRLQE